MAPDAIIGNKEYPMCPAAPQTVTVTGSMALIGASERRRAPAAPAQGHKGSAPHRLVSSLAKAAKAARVPTLGEAKRLSG